MMGLRMACLPATATLCLTDTCLQAYGMMGWRTGYIAYPDPDGTDLLGRQFLKTQVRGG